MRNQCRCQFGFTMMFQCVLTALLVAQGLALDARVTHGENATPHEFPYQVSVQWGVPPLLKYRHICGGSIISRDWVLTAGHCVTEVPQFGRMQIIAGKHYINRPEPGEEVRAVALRVVHYNYPGGVAQHDIALMKVKSPFTFNKNIQAIALPEPNYEHTGNAVLTGWGSISTGFWPKLPVELQTVEAPIVGYNACYDAFAAVSNKFELFDTQVCTGPVGSDVSACSGDSGGPLAQYRNDRFEQVGVVSWGAYPCGNGAPSVYTRVSSYVDWINSKIGSP